MIKDIYIGNKVSIGLKFSANGSPVNLTGSTVVFVLKTTKAAESDIINKVITVHTDPTAGITTLLLTSEETATFPEGAAYYSVELIDVSAQQITVVDDTLKIIKSTAGAV